MKQINRSGLSGVIVFLFTFAFISSNSYAADYTALKDLNVIKAVFDIRSKTIKTAALQLDLIHQVYHDQHIRNISDPPEMAVVFGGAAVRLVSSDRDDFSEEEIMFLNLIEGKAASMIKDGIRLEVCMFAADIFDVEPETVLPGINPVENGWISLIGYQAQGYSLVPVF